jgi:putative addiction module component (TIGR02574 family)
MGKIMLADLLNLSVSERILLVEDIWDSIAELPEAVVLSEEQREELDRRLEAYHQNSKTGSPWDVVKAKVKMS